jgi:two-component system, OmpR family, response regulator
MDAPLVHILLIEDDPDVRTIATMALVDLGGFELEVCASGAEALATLRQASPQLILLDVMMPDMDGPMTLAEIRRLPLDPQPPVVFMTAKVQPQETQRYLRLGAAGIIAKPFDPVGLADQLRGIWRGVLAS